MQTETQNRRISPATGTGINERKRPVRNTVRGKRTSQKAFSSNLTTGPGILNELFMNIIPPTDLTERNDLIRTGNIDLGGSIRYLFDSAGNYCRLLNRELKITLTGKPFEDILNLYTELDRVLPDNQEINIDARDNRFVFIVYGQCEFPEEFVFLPVKNIEKMSPQMAEIFMEFVAFFSASQGISLPQDQMDYDYMINCWIPEVFANAGEYDETEIKEVKKYISGNIPDVFNSIYNISISAGSLLEKCKKEFKSANGTDKDLLDTIIEGIPLLESGSMDKYSYSPEMDALGEYEYYGGSPVEFERTLAIIWDDIDLIGQNLQDFLNTDIGELGCNGPTQFLILSPNTKETLHLSDYPMQFHRWLCKLYEKLEDYEQNN